jgi:hypothetical protein
VNEEGYPPSRWPQVPLELLLEEAGNKVVERYNGTLVSAHEPVHGSKSGTCLVAWPGSGRWWCSSCRQGGDALSLIMSLEGLSYGAARSYLIERFGPPAPVGRPHHVAGRREVFRHG